MSVEISVIIPVYNNTPLVRRSTTVLHDFLARHFGSFEIILVDDGSNDNVSDLIDRAVSHVRVIRNETNRGKGFSVARGMHEARGAVRAYTDADLPYDLDALLEAYRLISRDHAVAAFGDRTHPHSRMSVHEPVSRRVASAVFRFVLTGLVLGRVADSQCGLKVFSADLADALFPLLTIDRFAFDVELLYLLKRHGIPYQSLPVHYVHSEGSSVRLRRDVVQMVGDALSVPLRWRHRRGAFHTLDRFTQISRG